MTQNNIQSLIQEFEELPDWSSKYEKILELSQTLPRFKESLKVPENLISGCSSRSWLEVSFNKKNQILSFSADSDSVMVKGLIAIILRVFDKQNPTKILETDLEFLEKLGLTQNLSANRANGMLAIIKKIKLYASIFANIEV